MNDETRSWLSDDDRALVEAAEKHFDMNETAFKKFRTFARVGKLKGTPDYFQALRELGVFTLSDAREEQASLKRRARYGGKTTNLQPPVPADRDLADRLWKQVGMEQPNIVPGTDDLPDWIPEGDRRLILTSENDKAKHPSRFALRRGQFDLTTAGPSDFRRLRDANTFLLEDALAEPEAVRRFEDEAERAREVRRLAEAEQSAERDHRREAERQTYAEAIEQRAVSGIPGVSKPVPPAPRQSGLGQIALTFFHDDSVVARPGGRAFLDITYDDLIYARAYARSVLEDVICAMGDRQGQDPAVIAVELRAAFAARGTRFSYTVYGQLAAEMAKNDSVHVLLEWED